MKSTLILFPLLFCFSGSISSQIVSDKYEAAKEAYEKRDFGTAFRLFGEFFTQYRETDEIYASAKYYAADALLNLGKLNAAAVEFEVIASRFKWSVYREISLYKLGLIYFEAGDYSKCRQRLKELLEDYEESEFTGSAMYWIGESYSKENKFSEAIDFLEDAVLNRNNNKFIDYTIFTLANVYEKVNNYEKAIYNYDQLLSYYRESPLAASAQMRIGSCYFRIKDYDSAILELKSPLIADLTSIQQADALYLLANSFYRVKEFENAEKTYFDLIQKYPSIPVIRDAKYGLAWAYFQQKKYNDAFKIFNSLSDGKDSIGIKSFFWKAESKRYAGQESEAFNLYMEFMKKYPHDPLIQGVQMQIGIIYFNQKKYETAIKYLNVSKDSEDNLVRARSNTLIGEIELNRQQFVNAAKSFENVGKLENLNSEVYNRALLGLGISQFYMNKFDEAYKTLSTLSRAEQNFERDKVNFYLGEINFSRGKFSDAYKNYSLVSLDDKEVGNMALYGKAYCLFNTKDYANAVYQFSDFIKKFPKDYRVSDARLRLADSYYAAKNFSEASRVYKEAFKLKSNVNDPYIFYQYAQALYKAGNIQEALNEFSNLQNRFPNSGYADKSLFVTAWIYFQQGNFSTAINKYWDVLYTYPNSSLSPLVYYSIGDSYFNLGNYDSAVTNYQRVVTYFPNSSYVFDAVNGIQYSYVAMGSPEKAIALLDDFVLKNLSLPFADQLYFKKGEINYSMRSYENAKASYKEFVANFPKSSLLPEAYYWIGKSAQNLNQFEEAIFNFNRVFEIYPNSESAGAAVIEMGNIYNQLKEFDKAIRIYDSAIEKMKNSSRIPELLFMKAVTLLNKGNIPSAYDILDEIVIYYANTIFAAKSKLELGIIELNGKRFKNADNYFKSLSELRTDDLGAKAQYYLGVSLFEQGKITEAITALVRVRVIFSAYDEWLTKSYLKLGECYEKLGDKQKAKEMYSTVLTKHKGDDYGKEAQKKLRAIK